MASIKAEHLSDDIPFGAKVSGVTIEALQDKDVRNHLREIFEDRAVLIFKHLDISDELHLALSEVFGPMQNHGLERDGNKKPALLELDLHDLSETDGKRQSGVLPWHFDSNYVGNINRGGVLRPVRMPPEGGETGFADGIQLYEAVSPDLRGKFEDLQILYYSKLMFTHQRFGFPKNLRYIRLSELQLQNIANCEGARRAVHPAIWTRETGERVLHVSPFQADGIYGHENQAGDELLEELCQEIYANMVPYWHKWDMSDLVLWDNWRCIHGVSGYDPAHRRFVQRYTIEGDYGLGFFEPEGENRQTEPAA